MVRIELALLDIDMTGKKNDQETHSVSLGSEVVPSKKDLICTEIPYVLHHWLFCEDPKPHLVK